MSHYVHNCNLDLFPCFCESKLCVQSLDSLLYMYYVADYSKSKLHWPLYVNIINPWYVDLFYYFNKLLFRFSKKLILYQLTEHYQHLLIPFMHKWLIIISVNTLICMDIKVTMCMLTYPFKVQITHNLKVHMSHACQMCVTYTRQRQKHTWYQTMHVHTCNAHLFN